MKRCKKTIRYRLKKSFFFHAYLLLKDREKRLSFKKKFPMSRTAQIKAKMAWLLYGLHANDFYRLSCENRPWSEIRNLISYHSCSCLYSVVNGNSWRVLQDKYQSYLRFFEFYKREMTFISTEDIAQGNAAEKIREFMGRGHQKIVVKQNGLNQGRGINLFDNADSVCKFLIDGKRGGVLEELIVQDKELAEFNSSSVNTLRINTMNYGNGVVEVLWPCLRMGRAGSFVDNAGAGGIFGAIDSTNGTIIGAADEHQHTYQEHPDSHKQLIGYIIPRWHEACELVKKAALKLPDVGFIGWDLALTADGWVMVEGNHAPLIIWQIASGVGIRKKFHEIEQRTVYKRE